MAMGSTRDMTMMAFVMREHKYKLDLFTYPSGCTILNRCHRHMLIQWLPYCIVHVALRKIMPTWLWLIGR
jgi:hypothetical protein